MQYQKADAQRQYEDYLGWVIIQKPYHQKVKKRNETKLTFGDDETVSS